MTHKSSRPKLNAQILDEAGQWFVELDEAEIDLAQRRAFDEWLRRSPEHVRAFLELVPLWEQAGAPRTASQVDPRQLIEMALNAGADVTPLVPATTTVVQPPAFVARIPARPYWHAAAAAMVVIGVILFAWWRSVAIHIYSTGTAEQRSVVLSDGSTIELNARSRMRVRFTATERTIDLIDGQVLFRVAKDASRPFVVRSEGARVQAIGTEFDVYRKKGKLTVTVLEGRVSVYPASAPPAEASGQVADTTVLLSAGQRTSIVNNAVEKPMPANVTAATAWTQRRLMFQKAPLAEVVDEFNRYNARQLRIEDAGIETFLVSGTFSSTDPASLLRFLSEQPGMRILEDGDVIRIVAAP